MNVRSCKRRRHASTLIAGALIAGALLTSCGTIDFPDRVVEPTQIGVISDIIDEPGANVVVFGSHRLRLSTDESHPGFGIDSLMLYWGGAVEPPFVTFARNNVSPRLRCYHRQAAAAFDEPDAIVVVVQENLELGIRLLKADGFETDPAEYDEETGAFTLPPPDFCLNEAGEVVAGGGVNTDAE